MSTLLHNSTKMLNAKWSFKLFDLVHYVNLTRRKAGKKYGCNYGIHGHIAGCT
jgi:hypothetical protein